MNDSDAIIKRLIKEGWERMRIKGSHHPFKKPGTMKVITVPHPRKDLPKGLRLKIEQQAGWR